MKEELLSPEEAAKELGTTTKRLLEWHEKGFIKAIELPNGSLQYPKDEVDSFPTRWSFCC